MTAGSAVTSISWPLARDGTDHQEIWQENEVDDYGYFVILLIKQASPGHFLSHLQGLPTRDYQDPPSGQKVDRKWTESGQKPTTGKQVFVFPARVHWWSRYRIGPSQPVCLPYFPTECTRWLPPRTPHTKWPGEMGNGGSEEGSRFLRAGSKPDQLHWVRDSHR